MGYPYPPLAKPTVDHEVELRRAYIEAMARAVVQDAELYGLVLTIQTKPRVPLAMGHHEMVVDVRVARELASPTIKGDWE